MINLKNYIYLRYVLFINIIAALIPAMNVKGRANDPLADSTWWTMDQHSAVLVVALAAIVASLLVLAVSRKGLRRWWIFVGCGIVAADFPATFYLAAAPASSYVPFAEMYVDGTFCGLVAGVVLSFMLRNPQKIAAK